MAASGDAGRRLDDLLETVDARLVELEAAIESTPSQVDAPAPLPEERESAYVLLVPAPSGYALVAHDGLLPARGDTIELPEREERYAVVKVVRTPSPDDRRPWVYLESAT